MTYYAHTAVRPDGTCDPDRANWQPLHTGDLMRPGHLEAVADLAAKFAAPFDAADWARLAGLWHDLGKYSGEFQTYLASASDPDAEGGAARGPDHSTAGAQHAANVFPRGLGRLLAYVIAGHHSGLADGISTSESCLEQRLRKEVKAWKVRAETELLVAQPPRLPPSLLDAKLGEHPENAARLALFLRFVFSALVDADRLDTEAFCSPEQSRLREVPRPSLAELETRLHVHLGSLDISRATAAVNAERTAVCEACLRAAELSPGFFSLTVPTGGGKTLSSLAFALRHAVRHGLRRVVYAIPFTSIVEQNAQVFRDALGDDALLEHHSNFEPPPDRDSPLRQLLVENWDAPLVVSTNVQLFESLFAVRPSRCRKLHNLARSVIILDEAQSIPVEFLAPCLFVLRELVRTYGCTVVLCTATQPAIQRRADFPIGIEGVREIVPDPSAFFRKLGRVRTERRGKLTPAELAASIASERQALAIVRTRREAAELFQQLPTDDACFHLSGQMCAMHRTQVLDTVRARLRAGEPCRLVSTNLIEAGVDVDFPVVFRALAGLDSVAQAAGRCNRGGLLNARGELGRLVIYGTPDECPVGSLRLAAQDAAEVLGLPEGADPLSLAAVGRYFLQHFWSRRDLWASPKADKDVLGCFPAVGDGLSFQFATAAERFRLIDDTYRPVVIGFDDHSRAIVASLFRGAPATRETFRALQRYTVTIPSRIWSRHVGGNIQLLADDRIAVLVSPEALYDSDLGLRLGDDVPLYNPDSTTCV
jgi:CRISPR-associated endonuclease/helicase Cas3